jgi:hypothetical protein
MICNIQTYYTYGYWPKNLKPKSNKPIIAVCDNPECGKIRVTSKLAYRKLCVKCAQQKRRKEQLVLDETKKKMSQARLKYLEKNPITDKTKKKMSNSAIKRCKDNPVTDVMKEKNRKGQIEYFKDITNREKHSAAMQHIPYDEWEQFASHLSYCPLFNEKCRESNREKYGRRCFLTGLLESENITKTGKQQKLSVHHIDMDKGQGCDGKRWKLVPLCKSWHPKVHNKLWEARIIWLLKNVWK